MLVFVQTKDFPLAKNAQSFRGRDTQNVYQVAARLELVLVGFGFGRFSKVLVLDELGPWDWDGFGFG